MTGGNQTESSSKQESNAYTAPWGMFLVTLLMKHLYTDGSGVTLATLLKEVTHDLGVADTTLASLQVCLVY
jgi:hypothetical protein